MAGAVVYAGLTFLISPKATLLIQTFMPIVMLITFLVVLGKPRKILPTENNNDDNGHVQVGTRPLVMPCLLINGYNTCIGSTSSSV